MPRRSHLLATVLMGIAVPPAAMFALAAIAEEPAAAPDDAVRLALLVGVQSYQHLKPSEQLRGSANDVQAMRQLLLEERMGFAEDNVVSLVNDQATAAAIRKAMRDLVEQVRGLPPGSPPAQVVFHFSGHGSQVPDQSAGDPDRDETDGLDETLVPFDAPRQGGPEDLRDDELNRFATELCESGRARLWMVLDCCHSGTGARGATAIRQLDRSLPAATASPQGESAAEKGLPKGAVVLSACRAREVEPEYQEGDKHFGLLSRFVVQALSERAKLSDLSYDLLRQTIVTRYRQDPSVVQPPSPQLEGDGASMRDTVLGSPEQADRPAYWTVAPAGERGQALLKAGAFHGVAAGSLYELYAQPDEIVWQAAEQAAHGPSLGWLRVERVEGGTARCEVFRWKGDKQETAALPADFKEGVAVERYHHHGNFGIRLRVVGAADDGSDGPPLGKDSSELPVAIREGLETINGKDESPWLTWTEGDEACDLLLRIDGQRAAIFPTTGRSNANVANMDQASKEGLTSRETGGLAPLRSAHEDKTSQGGLTGGWGPIELQQADAPATLQRLLRQVCRARNLARLAETQRASAGAGAAALKLELMAVKLDGAGKEIVKSDPWPQRDGALVVNRGDLYAYRITNLDREKSWHVTILHIDPDMGIDQVLPFQVAEGTEALGEQELRAGANRVTDAFECQSGFGPRLAVALATREPNSYYMLAQPSLPLVRSAPTRGAAAGQLDSGSSLSQLLLEQTYFQTRGNDRRRRPQKLFDESWTAATLPFMAAP